MSEATQQPQKRKKKPPACDRCKAKRVLCHPVPGGSCPRCVENEVICTTTPVVRKRPAATASRKKQKTAEPADELIGHVTSSSQTPHFFIDTSALEIPQASTSTIPIASQSSQSSHSNLGNPIMPCFAPSISASEQLALACQRDNLVSHLLDLTLELPPRVYCIVLGDHPVLGPYSQWLQHLRGGYHPALLAALLALASYTSTHPTILGQGPTLPSSTSLSADYQMNRKVTCVDQYTLSAASVRRSHVCRDLYETAKTLCWETGAMAVPTRENAATCYLLDLLETTYMKRNKSMKIRPYHNAFITMLEGVAEIEGGLAHQKLIGFSMFEAITSFSLGVNPVLTAIHDTALSNISMVFGPVEKVQVLVDRLEGLAPDRINYSDFAGGLRDFVEQIKRLARQYSIKLFLSTPASDEVHQFLDDVEGILRISHHIGHCMESRPELVRLLATASPMADAFHTEKDIVSIMQSSFQLPLASFLLPVYESLSSNNAGPSVSDISSSTSSSSSSPAAEENLQDRLCRLTERALKLLLSTLSKLPMIGYIASLPFVHLDRWAVVMTTLYRRPQSNITLGDIQNMLEYLTVYAFSLPVDEHILAQLRAELDWRKLQDSIFLPVPASLNSISPFGTPPTENPAATFEPLFDLAASEFDFGAALNFGQDLAV